MAENLLFYIIIYIFIFVCLIGIIGNILSFIVFSRKKFQNTIFSTYFRILAICDLLTLLFRTEFFLSQFQLTTLISFTEFLCKIHNFLIYLIPCLSIWILLLISLDRSLSILTPAKFLFRKKQMFQLLACLIISVYNILLCFPLFFTSTIEQTPKNSTSPLECNNQSVLIDLLQLASSAIIPFILMLISSILIIKTLFNSRKNSNNSNRIKKKDIKFAFTSIGLNISFFILNFPLSLYLIISYFVEDNFTIHAFLSMLLYSHYCTLFFVSYFLNSTFKKEFLILLFEIKNMIF
jgi:hypothetical protein